MIDTMLIEYHVKWKSFDQVNGNHCKLILFIFGSNNASWFIPKNIETQKLVICCLSTLQEEKQWIWKNYVSLKDLCFCFWQYQFCLILISYEEGIRIFFKRSVCWIFLNIFEELLGEAMMQILLKDWRVGYQIFFY
jgi:hypothetical protein